MLNKNLSFYILETVVTLDAVHSNLCGIWII